MPLLFSELFQMPVCLYFELLLRAPSRHSQLLSAGLNFVSESQSASAGMPRHNSPLQQLNQTKNKYYEPTVRWLTESVASGELWVTRSSRGDGHTQKWGVKMPGDATQPNCESWIENTKLSTERAEWLMCPGSRAMSRNNTKTSCKHSRVRSRFSSKITR